MVERILLFINFKNIFISISLNVSNIKLEKDSNIDELKNLNIKYIDIFDI